MMRTENAISPGFTVEEGLEAIARGIKIDLEQAKDMIRFENSYSRLGEILMLRRLMERAEWLRLLGEEWTGFDNVGEHAPFICKLLGRKPILEMMTEEERSEHAALPDRVTIYRGADRGINERGLCWTLDRETALCFPFLNRYTAKDPVLVTAEVARTRVIALKKGRGEEEVITQSAEVKSIEAIAERHGRAALERRNARIRGESFPN